VTRIPLRAAAERAPGEGSVWGGRHERLRPGAFDRPPRPVYLRRDMAGSKLENESKPLDFETAMRDLEQIVERLEHGDLPLEESLAAFERGVILTRSCQTALKEAEQKVEILLKKAGGAQVEDFDPESLKSPD
jgi:exodeoxyribonuclease VII small subunit